MDWIITALIFVFCFVCILAVEVRDRLIRVERELWENTAEWMKQEDTLEYIKGRVTDLEERAKKIKKD